MKQHITIKQLKELSDFGKGKLRKWSSKQHPFYLKAPNIVVPYVKGGLIPLLSIGQMLEFLEENTKSHFSIFRRTLDWKIVYEDMDFGKIAGGELCDALWEACKEILEK